MSRIDRRSELAKDGDPREPVMNGTLACAFLVLCVLISQSAVARSRALTIEEAKDLAMAAVTDWHDRSKHLPGFELDPDPYEDPPGFLSFEAMWRGACAECGSALGHFTVNMNDADIYDPILFKEIRTVSVRRLQVRLRRELKLDHKSYVKYRMADKFICWHTIENPDGPLVCPR